MIGAFARGMSVPTVKRVFSSMIRNHQPCHIRAMGWSVAIHLQTPSSPMMTMCNHASQYPLRHQEGAILCEEIDDDMRWLIFLSQILVCGLEKHVDC